MKVIATCKAPQKFNSVLAVLLIVPTMSNAQSDLTAIVRGGEILVGGLITIFASSKSSQHATTVESVCVKNKMEDKITLVISKPLEEGEELKKELVIQSDSKECFYDLPKGVYIYQIILANEEIFKKGEYRFKDKTVITIKGNLKEAIRTPEPEQEPKETASKTEETKTPIQ